MPTNMNISHDIQHNRMRNERQRVYTDENIMETTLFRQ